MENYRSLLRIDFHLVSHHILKPAMKSNYVGGVGDCCLNSTPMNLSFEFYVSPFQFSSMGGDALCHPTSDFNFRFFVLFFGAKPQITISKYINPYILPKYNLPESP